MCGTWDVDGLMRSMPSDVFAEWLAFFRVSPWGEYRADLRAGIIASTVATMNSTGRHTYKPSDFMVDWDQPAKPAAMSDKQLRDQWRAICASLNRRKPKC
jgi:hypothetical protein